MGANCAGIVSCCHSVHRRRQQINTNLYFQYGAQLYRSDDEPRYRRAFSICIAALSLGVILAIIRKVDEIFIRRRNGGKLETDSTVEREPEMYDDLKPAPTAPAPSNSIPQPTHVTGDIKPILPSET